MQLFPSDMENIFRTHAKKCNQLSLDQKLKNKIIEKHICHPKMQKNNPSQWKSKFQQMVKCTSLVRMEFPALNRKKKKKKRITLASRHDSESINQLIKKKGWLGNESPDRAILRGFLG